MKFFKRFNRKSASCFAAFLVLFVYLLSVPISAASVNDEFAFYQACPVVFNFRIDSTDTDNWLDPYSLDFNICPVASTQMDTNNNYSTGSLYATDSDIDLFGDASYVLTCTSSNLDYYGAQFRGVADYNLDFTQIQVFNGFSGMTSDYDYQYKYQFNNFWVWSYDFSDLDPLISRNSNISFSTNTEGSILSARLTYDILVIDSSGVPYVLDGHVLLVEYDDLLSGETFGNLTPEFFINHDSSLSDHLDSPDDDFFVYVNSWECTTGYNPSDTPSFSLYYTFNPHLNDLSTLYDYFTGGSSTPSNPAFGFIPYTDWLGSAVSGFFDLQIFPGFTLGGVFISVFAFACVMWFLKLVAGG